MSHFWFSKKQYTMLRSLGDRPCLAQLKDGGVVEYTEMIYNKKDHGNWEDYEYLGEGECLIWFSPDPGSFSDELERLCWDDE